MLRTVDRFKNMGVDYAPAIKELRAAFDEPCDFEKPEWRCVKMIDDWLKANR